MANNEESGRDHSKTSSRNLSADEENHNLNHDHLTLK